MIPSKHALDEMERMRNESLFTWQHPLEEMISGNRMIFSRSDLVALTLNILSDNAYAECCDLMCFTETHVVGTSRYTPTDELIDV